MAKSSQAAWVESQPSGSFFRPRDVPGSSRDAVRVFLHREAAKPELERLVWRVAPAFYWKPHPPVQFPQGPKVLAPCVDEIGVALAGPGAAAFGWYGANLVGWSTQVPARLIYAVPGEPRQRNPLPLIRLIGRRNLARRELTFLEATYLEAVIGFERWVETDYEDEDPWDTIALTETLRLLQRRHQQGRSLPRADVWEQVATQERPASNRKLFHQRAQQLTAVFRSPQSTTSADNNV